MKRWFIFLIMLAASHSLLARTYQEAPELAKVFKDKGVVGTFVLFDVATDTMVVWDEARARKGFTFKIANSFIGLPRPIL